MSIGEKIKKARRERGFTQVQLAKKSTISRSYLADMEADRYNPSIETLKRIARTLNMDISGLISDDEVDTNDELYEYLEELKNREEMRMLFSLAKNATKEDVEKAVKIMEALKE